MSKYDVAIVGGGPAGIAAALALQSRGLRTAVLEAGEPPKDKACGEGLLPDALLRLRGLGVPIDRHDGGIFKGIRFTEGRHTAYAEFPTGVGLGVRRTLLHSRLVQRAEQVGVDLHWNSPVVDINVDRVICRGRCIEARWMIGADGIHSHVRRLSGLDRYDWNFERIAFRRHYAVPPEAESVEVHWNDLAQCYVTPVSDHEVGVAIITRDRTKRFDELLQSFDSLNARFRRQAASSEIRGSLTATRKLRRIWKSNIALIGDASGSVDAISGEGICLALQQANALADAIAAQDLRVYARQHSALMARPTIMAGLLAFLGNHRVLRQQVLRAFAKDSRVFAQLLAVHVGTAGLRNIGIRLPLEFGRRLLLTR